MLKRPRQCDSGESGSDMDEEAEETVAVPEEAKRYRSAIARPGLLPHRDAATDFALAMSLERSAAESLLPDESIDLRYVRNCPARYVALIQRGWTPQDDIGYMWKPPPELIYRKAAAPVRRHAAELVAGGRLLGSGSGGMPVPWAGVRVAGKRVLELR